MVTRSTFPALLATTLAAVILPHLAAAQTEPDAPKDQEEKEKAPQTFEERLHFLTFGDHLFRGGKPAEGDVAELAKDHKVDVVACLLDDDEVPEYEQAEVEKAGMQYMHVPIAINRMGGMDAVHFDSQAAKRLVDQFADGDKNVYFHCSAGNDRAGFVNYAFRVTRDGWGYAEALEEAFQRGLHPYPGVMEDMKLLASGDDELPTVNLQFLDPKELNAKGETVRAAGVRINYKVFGEGPPLFLIHGGPGESHKVLRPYLDALKDNFTIVYYDQRGCGDSGRPPFEQAYTLDLMVKELDGLREHLGHDKIGLLGHSAGGVLAIKYALAHPEHVDKMVIASAWAKGEDLQRFDGVQLRMLNAGDSASYVMLQQRVAAERRRFNDQEAASVMKLFYPYSFYGKLDPEQRTRWERFAKVSSMVVYALTPEVVMNLDIFDRLGDLSGIPTLVIAGKFDSICPPLIQKPIAEAIPNARFEVFDRSGHYTYIEENQRFIDDVTNFLKSSD